MRKQFLMGRFFPLFLFFSWIMIQQNIFSQPVSEGAKPTISINGALCPILNQQFSCTMRTCDSIVIDEGDSIIFCTNANIDLSTDTAYYMQWNFTASSNYPFPLLNTTPSALPICYAPKWNISGTYTVDIFYNGWLSAYPASDCYSYGPSHWSLHVIVIPVSGMNNLNPSFSFELFPNPASEILSIRSNENEKYTVKIFDRYGRKVIERSFRQTAEIAVNDLRKGLYLVEGYDSSGIKCPSQKIIIE